jgi:hypothetical protein
MVRYVEVLDRTVRALTVELYVTRARHYDTLTQMLPAVSARIQPEYILYSRRTELPPGLVWPVVGGSTPARGPLLLVRDQILHQSRHGAQATHIKHQMQLHHLQLPNFRGFPRC